MMKYKECLLCSSIIEFEPGMIEWFIFNSITNDPICESCQSNFKRLDDYKVACDLCSRPLMKDSSDSYQQVYSKKLNSYHAELCYDCFRWTQIYHESLLQHQSIYAYNEFLQNWLHRYKYLGDLRLKDVMISVLQEFYIKYQDFQWTVLASSPESLTLRGFHPTAQLLEAAGIPYINILEYIGDGKKQVKKNRQERLNLQQPFRAILNNTEDISDRILIFDDIYTTGSTLIRGKEAIKNVFPKVELKSLSLGRHVL